MKLFSYILRVGSLRIMFFAFLCSLLMGSHIALAGGLPSKAGKEAPSAEQPVEEQPADIADDPAVAMDVSQKNSAGFSVGARGFLFLIDDSGFSAPATVSDGVSYGPLSGSSNGNGGYSFSLLLGYSLGNGLRLEAEAGYIHSCIDKMDIKEPGNLVSQVGLDSAGSPCRSGNDGCTSYGDLSPQQKQGLEEDSKGENDIDSKVSAFAFMLNAYYDINTGSSIVPYLGGGLGMLNLSTDAESTEGLTYGNLLIDDSDYVFAYQLAGGLGYRIESEGTDIILSVDYRYLASFEDAEFTGELAGNTTVETEFSGHYIGGGVRLAF